MEKKHHPSIFARHKRYHGNKLCLYFPKTFKIVNILLVLPIGTALVEWSVSDLKMIKTRLRSHLSESSVAQLTRNRL